MMDVGGANEELLVQPTRVDSKSIAEGTYAVTEAGQVVVVLDNSYRCYASWCKLPSYLSRRSFLTSKTVAYRTWVEKGAQVEGDQLTSSSVESAIKDQESTKSSDGGDLAAGDAQQIEAAAAAAA
eukprot:750871-Hanusia_phi.AAC.2